jgi:hypothetical protein
VCVCVFSLCLLLQYLLQMGPVRNRHSEEVLFWKKELDLLVSLRYLRSRREI